MRLRPIHKLETYLHSVNEKGPSIWMQSGTTWLPLYLISSALQSPSIHACRGSHFDHLPADAAVLSRPASHCEEGAGEGRHAGGGVSIPFHGSRQRRGTVGWIWIGPEAGGGRESVPSVQQAAAAAAAAWFATARSSSAACRGPEETLLSSPVDHTPPLQARSDHGKKEFATKA